MPTTPYGYLPSADVARSASMAMYLDEAIPCAGSRRCGEFGRCAAHGNDASDQEWWTEADAAALARWEAAVFPTPKGTI